jgi:hypothetical protein
VRFRVISWIVLPANRSHTIHEITEISLTENLPEFVALTFAAIIPKGRLIITRGQFVTKPLPETSARVHPLFSPKPLASYRKDGTRNVAGGLIEQTEPVLNPQSVIAPANSATTTTRASCTHGEPGPGNSRQLWGGA